HGQDISPEITPVHARLGWAVGWKKETFFGADALRALKQQGTRRLLRGLKATGRRPARPGMDVVDGAGAVVGVVTSGTYSPTLRLPIALALVDVEHGDGDVVGVDVRGRTEEFVITKPPFVTPGVREP